MMKNTNTIKTGFRVPIAKERRYGRFIKKDITKAMMLLMIKETSRRRLYYAPPRTKRVILTSHPFHIRKTMEGNKYLPI